MRWFGITPSGSEAALPAQRIIAAIVAVCRVLALVSFAGLFLLMAANVGARYFGLPSIIWSGDGTSFTMVWMVMMGAVLAMASGKHVAVGSGDNLPDQTTPVSPRSAFVALCAVVALGGLAISGFVFAADAMAQRTFLLQLPRAFWYAAIPLAATLMLAVVLARLSLSKGRGSATPPPGSDG